MKKAYKHVRGTALGKGNGTIKYKGKVKKGVYAYSMKKKR